MASRYPSPCLRCRRAENCTGYIGNANYHRWCSKWEIWFKWWWKQFRSAATGSTKTDPNKFYYSHPDHIKQQILQSPCDKCSAQERCEIPCKAYLQWYDTRMEIIRKKVMR